MNLTPHENGTKWINTYGLAYQSDFKAIILNNKLDDFLIKLLMEDDHATKVILLEDLKLFFCEIIFSKLI